MAGAFVNIGGDPADTAHRYRMPRLKTKNEGKGNGKKTVIVNMGAVARALDCSPRTVEIHRARVMEKMAATSVAQLVRMALSAGLEIADD